MTCLVQVPTKRLPVRSLTQVSTEKLYKFKIGQIFTKTQNSNQHLYYFCSKLVFLESIDTLEFDNSLQKYTHNNRSNNLDHSKRNQGLWNVLTSYGLLYQQISKEFLRPSDLI